MRLIEEELQIQRARLRQRSHKAGQLAASAADGDLAEVRPVHLGLFGGKHLQAQERFARRWRAQRGHGAPQLYHAPGVTALLDHLINARGAQPRILMQGLANEVQIGIGDTGAQGLGAVETIRFDGRLRTASG